MLQTDMRVMFVYEPDQPIPPVKEEDKGTLDLILYYAPAFGDFFKSDTLHSLKPMMRQDCLIILVSDAGQAK